MRTPVPFACDICHAFKSESNHWFLAWLSNDAPRVHLQTIERCLVISEWNDEAAEAENVSHLCGDNCVDKMTQRWLRHRSLTAPRTPAGDPS